MGRWTSIATWYGPIINSGDGDGRELEPEDRMGHVMGMVVHTAEGTFLGTISWQRNPAADVGSHFINAKDGRRAQMIDTRDRSWCQSAGNTYWVSSENEGVGSRGEALTPEQVESNAQEFAQLVRENPHIPLQVSNSPNVPGLGWHGMGGAAWGGHYDCPGPAIKAQLSTIVARAKQILGVTPTTDPKPLTVEDDDMTLISKQVPGAFAFDENGELLDAAALVSIALPGLNLVSNTIPWGQGYLSAVADAFGSGPDTARLRIAVHAPAGVTVVTRDVKYGQSVGWRDGSTLLPDGTTQVVIGRQRRTAAEQPGGVVASVCLEIGRRA